MKAKQKESARKDKDVFSKKDQDKDMCALVYGTCGNLATGAGPPDGSSAV